MENSEPENKVETIHGDITAVGSTVKMEGETYIVAPKLSGLFNASNAQVLKAANLVVTVTNNQITEVKKLTINEAGTLDAKATTITELIVNVDGVSIENLNVQGDVTLTNNVTDSFDVKNVKMGNFITPETPKLVASTRAIAAVTSRLKITFMDSTVAYVEIRQDQLHFSLLGSTNVTSMSIKADAAVIDSPNNLLPSIKITDGVTKVELNATIKNVEIETNKALEVTGKGNFDNVSVKSSQAVALLIEGTIGSLNTEAKNIELGTNVKVENTLLSGEKVDGAEIIVNITEVEGNVNQSIDENDKEAYFVAKPVAVEGKYGVYTLNLINAENATIHYEAVTNPRQYPMPAVGQQAPKTAKIYQPGDEYVAYFSNELYVYKTDANNVILETFKLDRTHYNPGYTKVVQNGNKLDIKVTFAEKQTLNYFMIATEKDFWVTEQFEYAVDADGVPTYTVTLPAYFELTSENAVIHETHGSANGRTSTAFASGRSMGNNEFYEQARINFLTAFANNFDETNFVGNQFGENFYQEFALNLNPVIRDTSILDVAYGAYYKTTIKEIVKLFKETSFTSFEEIQQAVKQIVDTPSPVMTQLKQVSAAISALYVANSDNPEDIRTDLKEQDFKAIQVLIDQLAGNIDQEDLQNALDRAQSRFEQQVKNNGTVAALEAGALRYSLSEEAPIVQSTVNW